MKNRKVLILFLVLIVAAAIVTSLMPPLVLEQIVNRLTTGAEVPVSFAVLYFGMLAISGVLDACKEILITSFGQKMTHDIRSKMCRKLNRLPAGFFTENAAGQTTSLFMNDVGCVESLFTNGIISMASDICKVVSIVAVIFTKSLGLGIMMLCLIPVLFFLTRSFQKRMLKAQVNNRQAIAKVNQFIPETIQNIRMIHSLNKQEYMEKRYDKSIQESYASMEKSNLYDSIYSPIVVMISTLTIAALMTFSAMGAGMQQFFGMSVGTAVAVISYVLQVFGPIEGIGMEIQNIQSAVAGVSRIRSFLREKERPEVNETDAFVENDIYPNRNAIAVSLEHVSFGYEESKTILQNMSMQILENEQVTLVGRTGAGKSTIFRLLLGLYSPWQGKVLIFGKEADQIPDREKRKIFGYVSQQFHMLPGTVAEQISLYDTDITKEMIQKAATLVGLHETIMKLQKGYDTVCSETLFSQGQLQLLSIARAVVLNPKILLLDEITANLDSITEERILRALNQASQGRTLISISHRIYEKMDSRLIEIS